MKNTLALLLLAMTSIGAHADELLLDLNLHALHFNREVVKTHNLNENNYGAGLEFRNDEYRKMVGFYKNSIHKLSGYALAAWTPIKKGPVEFGAIGGLVSGYANGIYPAAGLFSAVRVTDKINLNLTVVPDVQQVNCYGFIALQLAFRF